MNKIGFDGYCKKVAETEEVKFNIAIGVTVVFGLGAITALIGSVSTALSLFWSVSFLLCVVAVTRSGIVAYKFYLSNDKWDRLYRLYSSRIPDEFHIKEKNTYCLGEERYDNRKTVYVRKSHNGVDYWIETNYNVTSLENWIDQKIVLEDKLSMETVEV
jgi:hypothetical protein